MKCLNCGKDINEDRKFCSKSCAASFNNKLRNGCSLTFKVNDDDFKKIVNESKSYSEIANKLGYKTFSTYILSLINKRISDLNLNFVSSFNFSNKKGESVNLDLTKKELFDKSKNWQSARTCIRKIANRIFESSNKDRKCVICGYDKHIEIAHVKAVSEFSDDSLISEINSIENLVPLCPNHHWEFDNGLLSKEKILKSI